MSENASFLSRVEAFLLRHGMPASRFGRDAVGDGSFVRNLRSGSSPRLVTVDKVDAFMRARSQAKRPDASHSVMAAGKSNKKVAPPKQSRKQKENPR